MEPNEAVVAMAISDGGDREAGVVELVEEESKEVAVAIAISDGGDRETGVEPVEEESKNVMEAVEEVPAAKVEEPRHIMEDGGDPETGVEPVEEESGDAMEAAEEPKEAAAEVAMAKVEEESRDVTEAGEELEEVAEEEPEEAEDEEPEEQDDEEPEELEEEPDDAEAEGAEEDEEMEEEAEKVSEEGATVNDTSEIAHQESEEAQDEDKYGDNDKDEVADRLSNDEDADGCENDDPPNDGVDTSLLVLDSVPDGNDETLELFVGGLPKDCIEEDIRVVFSQCGEIESIKIVKKRKGIAFVRYADSNAAKKALTEFRDGIKVKGKRVRVSVSEPHRKPSEKPLMKVKTVYLEHFPSCWDERNIEECCEGYGNVQKVHILQSKKKVFSFVEFSSRKSALACIEGINNAEINDGEVKLAASLARPQPKVQLANECSKGGFKVHTGAISESPDKSKMKKDQKEEIVVKKSQCKLLKADVEVPQISTHSKGKVKVGKRQNTSIDERPSKKARKTGDESKLPSQDEGKVGKSKNTSVNERPLKKAWKNRDDGKLPSQGGLEEPQTSNRSKGKRKAQKSKNTTVNERPAEKAWKNRNMKHPSGSRYATNNQAYPSVCATSRSKPHAHDLEPHAGFIPPSNRVLRTPAHDHR
ncbi:hypothetical protein E2562_027182, partial [Oryza meyeriana var. granulata]